MFRLDLDVASSSADDAVLRCAGEVDLASAAHLTGASDLVPAGPKPVVRVVVDLRGVTFFDASGLGALIALQQRTAAAGSALVVRTPSRAVTRVLTLTGTRELFEVDDPVGDAA